MAQQYIELQSHLDRVRWAWKRAAALQGLAAVVIEALGMFLLFLLLDYIYVLPQGARVGTLALMGAILAFFFVRHVLRPLLRLISDEQIAMYIEERQTDTDGALLTATTVTAHGDRRKVADACLHCRKHRPVGGRQGRADSALAHAQSRQAAQVRHRGVRLLLLFFGISALRYSSFLRAPRRRAC